MDSEVKLNALCGASSYIPGTNLGEGHEFHYCRRLITAADPDHTGQHQCGCGVAFVVGRVLKPLEGSCFSCGRSRPVSQLDVFRGPDAMMYACKEGDPDCAAFTAQTASADRAVTSLERLAMRQSDLLAPDGAADHGWNAPTRSLHVVENPPDTRPPQSEDLASGDERRAPAHVSARDAELRSGALPEYVRQNVMGSADRPIHAWIWRLIHRAYWLGQYDGAAQSSADARIHNGYKDALREIAREHDTLARTVDKLGARVYKLEAESTRKTG